MEDKNDVPWSKNGIFHYQPNNGIKSSPVGEIILNPIESHKASIYRGFPKFSKRMLQPDTDLFIDDFPSELNLHLVRAFCISKKNRKSAHHLYRNSLSTHETSLSSH